MLLLFWLECIKVIFFSCIYFNPHKRYLEYHWDPVVLLCSCPIQTRLPTEREQSCGPRLRWSLPEECLPETWGAGGTACWALPSPARADRWCSDPRWTAGHLDRKERPGFVTREQWVHESEWNRTDEVFPTFRKCNAVLISAHHLSYSVVTQPFDQPWGKASMRFHLFSI